MIEALKDASGSSGPRGEQGSQGSVGSAGPRGERGSHGPKGDRGIQGVLSVLAEYLPIQLATRYGEKMCFIKYHVSDDKSSIVKVSGGAKTLRCISTYHEPAWHFDAKYLHRQGHTMTTVVLDTSVFSNYYLAMKTTSYYCPYDLTCSKLNAIFIVYKIRDYDSSGTEHNFLFSSG